ncbi:MAG: RHS repeat-associated core domain-containing protein [Eubacteriales bacterium]
MSSAGLLSRVTFHRNTTDTAVISALDYTFTNSDFTGITFPDGKSVSYSYAYDADGMRTGKTVGSTTTKYYYVGARLTDVTDGTNTLHIGYDGFGAESLTYNGTRYYYVKNAQGDVIGLVNGSGAVVAEYAYDAWGNILSISGSGAGTVGAANPIRYRGYVYDTETGLYYVSSRYYDPELGRWINADNVIAGVGGDLKGYNLFAYCFNNPVNMDDQAGNWPKWIMNTVKWVAKNIVKPVVKTVQKTLSKVDLTYSTGVNVSGTPSAWIFNGQIGVSMDTKGNVAIQASGGGGITGGDPGISITRYQSVTNAPNIDKLNDAYYQVGGSIAVPIEGVPVAAGGDVMFMPAPENNTGYFGITGNVGLGTPGKEVHVEWGTTVTQPYFQVNVYEAARYVYIVIMEW